MIDDPREGVRPVIAAARRHPHRIAIALHDNPKARDRDAADAPGLGELVHRERLPDSRMPALVAVSLYFSREERVPHLNATLMELKPVCGRR